MNSRFDYIGYDNVAKEKQASFKSAFQALEKMILELEIHRPTAIAITKLEEAYAWVGKAIRDEQIERSDKVQLEEQRSNS